MILGLETCLHPSQGCCVCLFHCWSCPLKRCINGGHCVNILLMTSKTLYQWLTLCQCWPWPSKHGANDDHWVIVDHGQHCAGQSVKCSTNHTAAEQPVQFYTNHTSTATEQPDNFKCIPTTWLEKTMARPYSFLQHKCRTVCQMLC